MKKTGILALMLAAMAFTACKKGESSAEVKPEEVQKFLDEYSAEFVKLYTASSEAHWLADTKIVTGDSANEVAARKADEAFADYTGSANVIEKTQAYLKAKDKLSALQVKQLEYVLYNAANNPATVSAVVKERIKMDTEQNKALFEFRYVYDGDTVSTNDIDEVLRTETSLPKRQAMWELSKEVGKGLKPGLVKQRDLRNQVVQALNYSDFFTYQASDYGMTTPEMMDLMNQMVKDIWPLYRELHTWARYELASKYKAPAVPEYLPAHWLPNRWGQDWSSLVEVKGVDLDGVLKAKGPEWLVQQAERFYVSLGFDKLPPVFYEKSSLYPLPAGTAWTKNNHASAWHMNLGDDVRSLMSVEPNTEWYETTHHELGHIYYYMCYSTPEVPPLLRGGANRGFHEAFGSLMGLAAMQKPFLEGLDLIPKNQPTDTVQTLLKEALNYVVFLPFGAGTMAEFEHDMYVKNLPADQFNARWWELAKKYQGIEPPTARGEEFCDAATKTHIVNDAAQYYDYAISYILLFQFHDHISKNILHQDPHFTNYFGNKDLGAWLKKMMAPGQTKGWRELMKEHCGGDMSAKPMLDYFMPLMDYLKKVNTGRTYTLPEQFGN